MDEAERRRLDELTWAAMDVSAGRRKPIARDDEAWEDLRRRMWEWTEEDVKAMAPPVDFAALDACEAAKFNRDFPVEGEIPG